MDIRYLKSFAIQSFKMYGVEFDDIDIDNRIIKISVPERSDHLNANQIEMSGDFLAKRVKQMLNDMKFDNIKVMYRIRKESYWTIDDLNKSKKEIICEYKKMG